MYANLAHEMKIVLWKELYEISLNVLKPWLLVRNLNDIQDPSKKKKGAPFNWHRANIFNNRINQCSLMELGTQGGSFTWNRPKINGYE